MALSPGQLEHERGVGVAVDIAVGCQRHGQPSATRLDPRQTGVDSGLADDDADVIPL